MKRINAEVIKQVKKMELALIEGRKNGEIDANLETRIENCLSDFNGRVKKGIRRFLHNHPRIENCDPKVWGGRTA